ncbi:DNA gyrase subunit A [Dethiobacter alkaliphilus]|uniref:DNA gyrase subunit A n=1 Tax=Dethiobacter alkaliphilus AHT 1 TaxID=555088 RepID=C0GI67_DETAL|nr:DNA gyrase subunit A [Dethiobacter alkaliphilus]EEG76915.1 DNA gyrase, A subunit [Dethiobacter alkaliphilus AHT 1]
MNFTHGKIMPMPIHDEVKNSFLDYAMSVIVSRALPDVRDGLKPVHRRILYAMYELGMWPDKPHKKSARLVGEVLGKYHPHGDTAVYDAMVRLAQNFSSRYPLVDGHGNFGSVDGDRAAAMRYTEARMSKIATEMLSEIHKETIDFRPNFDDTLEEPEVLPARFPNLLLNGSAGIAVGMATNIPPHNLREVVDALVHMIDNPECEDTEIMQHITGPDFPTGGLILGREGIRSAYRTGRGIIKIRAKTQIERMENGKSRIVVTELPYQVNKAKTIEKIADLVREKKLEGITDLRDESDRTGMRIVIELKRETNAQVLLNQMFKFTQLQQTFGIIMLALVNNKPQVLNLREMLGHYLEHQKDVITRRTRFDLRKAEERAHILEGLRIALKNLDAVIKLIRASKNTEEARTGLMENFGLTQIQAQAILDMRLQKLTGLERQKLEDEYLELIQKISYLKEILANERLVYQIIKDEMGEIRKKYGDDRRTAIVIDEDDFAVEDLIAEEDMVVTLTHNGYIKRLPVTTYRVQKRGGRGITGMSTKGDDFVEHVFVASTHDYLCCFTNRGKMYRKKVFEIPESGRTTRGVAIVNLLAVEPGEYVTAVIPVKDFNAGQFMFMCTRQGYVKKTPLEEFINARKGGLIALSLAENDELIDVRLTNGKYEVALVTYHGLSIRFAEENVRSMGRSARGVRGISLGPGDKVMSLEVLPPEMEQETEMLVVTEKGFGKRTPFSEYRAQTRGGKGIYTIRILEKNGPVMGAKMVRPGDEVMMITARGVVIRQDAADISIQGRHTQGVTLIRLDEGDRVVSLARVVVEENEA